MKRIISLLLAVSLVLSLCLTPASAAYSTSAPAAGQVVTQRDPLNIRSAAKSSAKVVGSADKGSYLQIVGESGDWYKVRYTVGGKTGYAVKKYLKIVSTKTGTVTTKKDPLVIRSKPSTSGKNLGQIPKGQVVPYLSKSGSWYQVVCGKKVGYVAAQYFTVGNGSTPSAKTNITFSSLSNPGTITKGKGVHISGTIKSTNSKLSSVTAAIVNDSGKAVVKKSVNPNAYSYSIYDSALDYAMTFGSLNVGSYTLQYSAKTADGTSAASEKLKCNVVKNDSSPEPIVVSSTEFSKAVYSVAHAQKGNNYEKYASRGTPWCGYYAKYVLKNAYKKVGADYSDYVPANKLTGACGLATAYKSGKYGDYYSFSTWSYKSYSMKKTDNLDQCKPKVGDLIITETYGGLENGLDHIGVIIKVNSDGTFVTSEGNTGSGTTITRTVKEHTYKPRIYNGAQTWQRSDCSGGTCVVHVLCSVETP